MEQLELSAPSIVALFDTTKAERITFAEAIVNTLEEGIVDPLKVHLQLKCMEGIIDMLTNTDPKKNPAHAVAVRYKALILEAAERQGGKSFEFHQGKFEIKEVGTKYDWASSQDPEIIELLAEQKAIDAKVKSRQDFLKNLPEGGMTAVNEGSGEVVTLYRPAKSSSTSVAVTLK